MKITSNPLFDVHFTGTGFQFYLQYDHLGKTYWGEQGENYSYWGGASVTFLNRTINERYEHYVEWNDSEYPDGTIFLNGSQDLVSARKYIVGTYISDRSMTGDDQNETFQVIYYRNSDGARNVFSGLDHTDIAYGADYVDILAGQNGDDVLDGGAGDDRLVGGADNDRLFGREGNDSLDGGTGIDTLAGGTGNDTYVVDTIRDKVFESAGSTYGTDTVKASVSYTLSTNVERLVLTGSANLSGTGNAAGNTITSNAGANVLAGGLSNDILTGGGGKDTIAFDTTIGTSNVDRITDFRPVDDTIRLDNAIFKALTKTGTLSSAAFKDITDGAALDSNDRILYNHDTGRLSYDADGSGATKAVTFAILDTHPTLTFQDFTVV